MDNIVEIIILLAFFILSTVGNALSKKKKREEANKRANQDKVATPPVEQNRSIESKINEFFGIEVEPEQKVNQTVESTWNPEDDYVEAKPETIIPEIVKQPYPFKNIVNKERDEPIFETPLIVLDPNNEANKKAERIRGLVKRKNSFQDSFIISEILQKPLALRR